MAQKKKPQASGSAGLKGYYIVLALVAVAGLVALGYSVLSARSGGAALQPVDLGSLTDAREILAKADGVRLGPDDAPVKLITFIDFQCPACAQFGTQIEPLLRQTYVQPGKVQIIYYDWPIVSGHPHAFVAARAARCAGEQNKFWEFHDVLLARQTLWTNERSVISIFGDYAAELGMQRRDFDSCLKSDRYAETVTASMLLGNQLGVNGTPTILLNSKWVQAWNSWAELRQQIDAELGG